MPKPEDTLFTIEVGEEPKPEWNLAPFAQMANKLWDSKLLVNLLQVAYARDRHPASLIKHLSKKAGRPPQEICPFLARIGGLPQIMPLEKDVTDQGNYHLPYAARLWAPTRELEPVNGWNLVVDSEKVTNDDGDVRNELQNWMEKRKENSNSYFRFWFTPSFDSGTKGMVPHQWFARFEYQVISKKKEIFPKQSGDFQVGSVPDLGAGRGSFVNARHEKGVDACGVGIGDITTESTQPGRAAWLYEKARIDVELACRDGVGFSRYLHGHFRAVFSRRHEDKGLTFIYDTRHQGNHFFLVSRNEKIAFGKDELSRMIPPESYSEKPSEEDLIVAHMFPDFSMNKKIKVDKTLEALVGVYTSGTPEDLEGFRHIHFSF